MGGSVASVSESLRTRHYIEFAVLLDCSCLHAAPMPDFEFSRIDLRFLIWRRRPHARFQKVEPNVACRDDDRGLPKSALPGAAIDAIADAIRLPDVSAH